MDAVVEALAPQGKVFQEPGIIDQDGEALAAGLGAHELPHRQYRTGTTQAADIDQWTGWRVLLVTTGALARRTRRGCRRRVLGARME